MNVYKCERIWQNQASIHIQFFNFSQLQCIMSHHAIDLEFSHNFVMFIKHLMKFEIDGILVLRVMNHWTCKIGCVWNSGFVKSGHKYICDWILENWSKSHIRSFEINSFKDLKPLQFAKGSKHEYENYTRGASIYHLSDNLKKFWLLSKFPTK